MTSLGATLWIGLIAFLVAEAIALKLRRESGAIYLDTQLFTGCMFVCATICLLTLRSWRVVKTEHDVFEKRRAEAQGVCEQQHDRQDSPGQRPWVLEMIKSLVMWKRV